MSITIAGPKEIYKLGRTGANVISTVSHAKGLWSRALSPFLLGPVALYQGHTAQNMENGWQYSKVYSCHLDDAGNPSPAYFQWAQMGWDRWRADRYPMGKGARPAYSWWNGEKLGYLAARAGIYFPLYRDAVRKTEAWARLHAAYGETGHLVLFDFDGWDHDVLGMPLGDVLRCETRKMGHAFVLKAMLLYGDTVCPADLPCTPVGQASLL